MHPPFSMVFATTLFGIGQGLFLALMTLQTYSNMHVLQIQDGPALYGWGAVWALAFLGVGLFSSTFHLGHPERAWRAVSQWRTSWLSREVILLPVLMALVFVYGGLQFMGWDIMFTAPGAPIDVSLSFVVGWLAVIVNIGLFVATGMIYAAIRFIQEWRCAMTPINYILLGTASGFLAATALATVMAPGQVGLLQDLTIILMVVAIAGKFAHLWRNGRIKYKSNVQTAIGIRHTKIQQKSMGFMGGSFNTKEFFSHKSVGFRNAVRWGFIVLAFAIPLITIIMTTNTTALIAAVVVMYIGLVMERWHFFASANHPQNLYYQTVG
ncbi:MAG: dimethyl sulfoxide reductase anchor subunit [Gammaproteobacteria bacterium]|nr:dimethyl sulfoxide reductase anchor subunit [Gammaproteobacteria bacterium]